MDGTWSSSATSSRGVGMPSGDAPRLRVVAGGGLSSGGIGAGARGARLRAVDRPVEHGGTDGTAFDWRAELEFVAPDILLPPGCRRESMSAAEGSLGWSLPPQQVEFLTAVDGVYDVDSHHWYAWSLERLVDENFEAERPSDLLLIGDDAAS